MMKQNEEWKGKTNERSRGKGLKRKEKLNEERESTSKAMKYEVAQGLESLTN